jgi:hypothetical protein
MIWISRGRLLNALCDELVDEVALLHAVVLVEVVNIVDVVLVTEFMRSKVALPGPDTIIEMGVIVFGTTVV